MNRPLATFTLAITAGAMLAGCYQSPGVTVHKPGVYKGERDPLLALQRSPQQQETLRERFTLGQTDR